MAPASPTSTRRGRGERAARRAADLDLLAGDVAPRSARSGRFAGGRRGRARPRRPRAARGGEAPPRRPAAGERAGAERGGGEEHQQRGRGVAEVLEARGGVERDQEQRGRGPEQQREGEAPAAAIEHGGEAQERHRPRGARAAEGHLEGLGAERGEVLDGLEGDLERRGVRVRAGELAHGAGGAPLARERAVGDRLGREEDDHRPEGARDRGRRPQRARGVHHRRARGAARAAPPRGGWRRAAPAHTPAAPWARARAAGRRDHGPVRRDERAAEDGAEERRLHAREEAPVEDRHGEEQRGERPRDPPRRQRAQGAGEIDEGGARDQRREEGEALAAKAEQPPGREHQRVGQAGAAGGVAVAGDPREGVPERRGAGEAEVDVDVVERDGEVARPSAPRPGIQNAAPAAATSRIVAASQRRGSRSGRGIGGGLYIRRRERHGWAEARAVNNLIPTGLGSGNNPGRRTPPSGRRSKRRPSSSRSSTTPRRCWRCAT